MNSGFQYLWEASICLAGFYTFYWMFLARDSFYQRNRLFLLCSLGCSMVLPVLNFSFGDVSTPMVNQLVRYQSDILWEPEFSTSSFSPNQEAFLNWPRVLLLIYLAGVLLSLFRAVRHLLHLKKICDAYEVKSSGRMKLILTDSTSSPFSFFHFVFLNSQMPGTTDAEKILMHEAVHVRQLHTLDLILVEAIRILFWFNPFIYLYRNALVEVHEYLADQGCIRQGICSIDYQKVLLHSVQNHLNNALASGFTSSLTLKRIKMMTRIKTPKFAHSKLALALPVIAFLLMSFSIDQSVLKVLEDQVSSVGSEKNEEKPHFQLPVKVEEGIHYSSGYGWRMHPIYKVKKLHQGTDIAGPKGTPILSVEDGLVSKVVKVKGYGKYIVVDHTDGFSSLYAQLDEYAVKEGQKVKKGEVIGYMGRSGISTGTHLHFELRKDGAALDPAGYIDFSMYSQKK